MMPKKSRSPHPKRWNGHRRDAPVEPLSARIVRLRIARGYSVYELATAAGVFTGTIKCLESGKPADKQVLSALARALGVPLCRLVCGEHSCAERACVLRARWCGLLVWFLSRGFHEGCVLRILDELLQIGVAGIVHAVPFVARQRNPRPDEIRRSVGWNDETYSPRECRPGSASRRPPIAARLCGKGRMRFVLSHEHP